MNWIVIRRWVAPALLFLIGLLGSELIWAGWAPNLLFQGIFHFDLAALLLSASLLVSLFFIGVIVIRNRSKHQIQKALTEERETQKARAAAFLTPPGS